MKQGDRMAKARIVTLSLVFIAVIVSLAFDSGLGTPSSFGIGQFFLLCPLGALEAFVASKSFIPVTFISLAVVAVMALLFGRAWCAWGCPAPVIRRFFKRDRRPAEVRSDGSADDVAGADGCSATCGVRGLGASVRHIAHDTRTWILAGVLVATLVAGFPLFCLVCPVGLTFGTVGSLWHLIVDKQVTLSVVVFPIALAVELVLCRTWCTSICPIAGLLNIFGHIARMFRPRVDASTCLRADGKQCTVCTSVCSERIDLHAADASVQLGECTRCGECVKQCPTHSIRIEVDPGDKVVAVLDRRGAPSDDAAKQL